ncbi:hypothetical protein [Actinomadura rubrisoli]|uniref:hypothetical protein n=1 Tax=Actinomadura rubrisoli TaxID=2530368 RepID=UPI00140531C8|nr:hypothetical protein [Actinomadura rubrisoli]
MGTTIPQRGGEVDVRRVKFSEIGGIPGRRFPTLRPIGGSRTLMDGARRRGRFS